MNFSKPDFAFPKKVAAGSLEEFDKALKTGNSQQAVRALINYALAEGLADRDSVPKVINLISTTLEGQPDPATRSLLLLVEAQIYNEIYQMDKWKFDGRDPSLSPLSENYLEWSGEQFQGRIISLIDQALADKGVLKDTPLKDYSDILTVGNDTATYIYYPSLLDFVSSEGISLCENMARGVIFYTPDRVLRTNVPLPVKTIDSLYRMQIGESVPLSAPNIRARLAYHYWVGGHMAPTAGREKRIESLFGLYDECISSEYSGDILQEIASSASMGGLKLKRRIYSAIVDFIRRYPEYYGKDCLDNSLKTLGQPRVSVTTPKMTAPGRETDISVKVENAREVAIEIYSLPTEKILSDDWIVLNRYPHKLVSRITTKNVSGEVPFDTTLTISANSFPKEGYYVVVPTIPDTYTGRGNSYPVVYCTRNAMGFITLKNTCVVALDPLTGRPIAGSDVKFRTRLDRNEKFLKIGETDKDGFFELRGLNSGEVAISTGTDYYTPTSYYYPVSEREGDNLGYRGGIFTALQIYRPGDKVEVAAVAYTYDNKVRRPLADNRVKVIIRDVNYQKVDSITGTTDAFGRISGDFVIPTGRVTGNYSLQLVRLTATGERIIAHGSVMVSDYKLPTFRVGVEDVMVSTPAKGDVTITGKISTYSGFGMGDAKLDMELSVSNSYWWWRGGLSQSLTKTPVEVGGDGSFKIVIDKSAFDNSPYPQGRYTALFTATSPNGESQTASRSFAMGEAYTIKADIPSSLDVTKPVRLDVAVFNSENQPVDAVLEYILSRDKGDTIRGTLDTRDPVVDLTRLAPAIYTLELNPGEGLTGKCESEQCGSVAIYRPDINVSPSPNPLWSPQSEFTASPGSRLKILYGTPGEVSHILVVTQVDDSAPEYHWIETSAGLHTYEFKMPEALKVKVTMLSTYDYSNGQLGFVVSNPVTTRRLKVERESFRDHLTPGAEEKWVIRITDNDGSAQTAAVMVDMYNSALDALVEGGSWQLSVPPYPVPWLRWSSPSVQGSRESSIAAGIKYGKCNSVIFPQFDLYGYRFYQQSDDVFYKLSSRSMLSKAEPVGADDVVVAAEHSDAVMVNSVMTSDTSAVGAVSEEAEMDEGVIEAATPDSEQKFEFRDAETPLALFRPTLTTDTRGKLTLEFTVPNANAAWNFNALAWNSEMVTGSTQAEVTSAKPVMVQPNLPRFLRTGDEAVVQALVMNNSDSCQKVRTLIEIFDPSDNSPLRTPVAVESELAPQGSSTAEITVNVPDGITMVGYRVKSSTDEFADGEQAAIPVLPSYQPVIEAQPFYIAPDDQEFRLRLPKTGDNASVTLQYCENPAWYVVTALPGLSADKPRTAVEAAVNIFSIAVAEGLVKSNKSISNAIKEWSTSDRGDSTLVSMLERNADLKTVLLQATPWMMDARSDTERMERLVLLFDHDRCKKALSEAVGLLSDLQQGDGGWGWTPCFNRSSEWVTYLVLDKMGGLLRLKFMPEEEGLMDMIEKAVKYTDEEAIKTYRKYPKADFISYTTMRDLFTSIPQSTEAKHISDMTVRRMLKSWKKFTVKEKCFTAMTFYVHGYKDECLNVLESLREFSVYQPSKGMWWPSEYGGSLESLNVAARILDVISLVEPGSEDIDRIRQWLIYEKETSDWGDGPTATAVIGSFLTVSDRWISTAGDFEIKVGGKVVHSSPSDHTMGYLRTDISDLDPSEALLTIVRSEDTPAWGAVYEQYSASMEDIKAVACESVKIEKRLSIVDGSPIDSLKKGDRVRIQLLITTTRNMDYVTITDERAACLEPVDQLPGYLYSEGLGFYRENNDSSTRIFIDTLPKGTYILTYDMFVNNAGRYSSGIATIQSQYAPSQTAHSSSSPITVYK